MSTTTTLLDTPKKLNLQTQSSQLRAALKDFERTFAANNEGRKPSKDDIKEDADIAVKYKEYNRVRDVLAGKLSYEVLTAQPKSPARKKQYERVDSGLSWSPRRKSYDATPRKNIRPNEIDPYDAPASITPRPLYLNAIGPTPQRDGRVLGLFDMMSNSTKSSQATPSGSRKRKAFEMICESPQQTRESAIVQTPSQKRNRNTGDLLQHLTDAHEPTPETGHRKNGRTPVSEGRKFMLSQFFATPNTTRYSDFGKEQDDAQKTPLRDDVLGQASQRRNSIQDALDATPAYLKRTTSFKERLLSASSPALRDNIGTMKPPNFGTGPPTLQHFRSVTRSSSQSVQKLPPVENSNDYDHDNDDNDDDLEALRELESSNINVLVGDSQVPDYSSGDERAILSGTGKTDSQSAQVWKKKGQKRTTRTSKIRPGIAKMPDAPKFVVAEDPDEDNDLEDSQVKETQIINQDTEANYLSEDDYDTDAARSGIENEDGSDNDGGTRKSKKKSAKSSKSKKEDQVNGKKKAGTINPNAQSHMNFRSLKIRNKNSKAKGAGRGKFGRR